jgi:hypothetical protein
VLVVNPHAFDPFVDATEIAITGSDAGRIITAAGCGSHGEPVRRTRNESGSVRDVWLAASRLRPERQVAADMLRRYAGSKRDKTDRT